jgi:hypothetical protein
VRHTGAEDRVAAGDQWPRLCKVAPSAPAAGRPTDMKSAAVAPGATASTLAEQNDLLTSAVAARRRGDAHAALAALDRFLVLYPASPLAEGAAAERMRLLHSVAPSRAVVAARDYLARYPNGFARTEAEGIVAGAP